MKIEQDDALIQATQEAEEVQIALTDYECYMQERMSEFIRNKIALRQ